MNKKFELALVTGASSGIGRELCRFLAKKGIHLMISARSVDQLEALATELKDQVDVQVIPADLAKRADRQVLIDQIKTCVPDLVINNAGWGYYGEALSYPTEISMDVLEVDVVAVQELSLEAARAMVVNKKEGVIVNISSAAAFQVFPCFSVYAASKAFVNLFSESFDAEMRTYGVRVLASCPGMVDTNFRYRASGDKTSQASSSSMTPHFAAQEIWRQIEQEKPLHTFDWRYRVASFFTRYLLPKRFVTWAVRRSIEKRQGPRKILVD